MCTAVFQRWLQIEDGVKNVHTCIIFLFYSKITHDISDGKGSGGESERVGMTGEERRQRRGGGERKRRRVEKGGERRRGTGRR